MENQLINIIMVTVEKDMDIKENQENNGIHMIDRMELEEEEVDIRKQDMEKEIGEMMSKYIKRRVKQIQNMQKKKRKKNQLLKVVLKLKISPRKIRMTEEEKEEDMVMKENLNHKKKRLQAKHMKNSRHYKNKRREIFKKHK